MREILKVILVMLLIAVLVSGFIWLYSQVDMVVFPISNGSSESSGETIVAPQTTVRSEVKSASSKPSLSSAWSGIFKSSSSGWSSPSSSSSSSYSPSSSYSSGSSYSPSSSYSSGGGWGSGSSYNSSGSYSSDSSSSSGGWD